MIHLALAFKAPSCRLGLAGETFILNFSLRHMVALGVLEMKWQVKSFNFKRMI
jgi:hypothetical protein